MPPDEPTETPAAEPGAEPGSEPSADRASLQADLRKERKKAKKHRRRWLRRTMYSLLALVILVVAAGAGLYFYAGYRFDQIKKVHSKHLVQQAAPGKPFNVLLVGSDSRAFVDNSTQEKAFGDNADAGGQRSDVTMVARFVPATKTVTVLSIPRDLWVDIPKNSGDIVGMNRINAAYDVGPDLLIQTIENVLHIPINHYLAVNFPGFSGMVDALGGVTMDFPTSVRDTYTGLHVTTLGCQVVNGTTALELVRSRHLQYVDKAGYWTTDGLSDFSRIQRQDSFFRAVLAKVNSSITNPLAINGFVSAAVGNLTIDDTLSKGDLLHIASEFQGLQTSHLITETLPTTSYVTSGGADVLLAAQPYAQQMITAFNQLGEPKPSPTTTTGPTIPPSSISVQVLNAVGYGELAGTMAASLKSAGFDVTEINDAPVDIASGDPSQILYGPDGLAAAHSLGATLSGGSISYVSDPSLTGNTLQLRIASSELVDNAPASTSTTTPGSSTTPTTIPSDVYTNKQAEPWNPVPCTLGATKQASG